VFQPYAKGTQKQLILLQDTDFILANKWQAKTVSNDCIKRSNDWYLVL